MEVTKCFVFFKGLTMRSLEIYCVLEGAQYGLPNNAEITQRIDFLISKRTVLTLIMKKVAKKRS